MSETRSLEQRRADFALRQVRAYKDRGSDKDLSLYRSYVSSFSAQILMSGLGQAAATLLQQSKGSDSAHKALYDHLGSWLCGGDAQSPYQAGATGLIDELMANDQKAYLIAQAEALQYLDWLKRFSVAFFPKIEGAEE